MVCWESGWITDTGERKQPQQSIIGFSSVNEGPPLSGDLADDTAIEAANRAGINRKIYAGANAPIDEDGNRTPNRWLIGAHNIRHGFGTYMVNETRAGLRESVRGDGSLFGDEGERIHVEYGPRAGLDHSHQYGSD